MRLRLQVALDLAKGDVGADRDALFEKYLKLAKEAVAGGAELIEAGTPLIKGLGTEIIRELKKGFPDQEIVADMKTMDTGDLEVHMAAEAGADIVIVEFAADEPTLKKAIAQAEREGVQVMIGTTGCVVPETERLLELRPDYVLHHKAKDRTSTGDIRQDYGLLEERLAAYHQGGVQVAVAGDLTKERVVQFEAYREQIGIFIVGGAITAAPDPKAAAREIKKVIERLS